MKRFLLSQKTDLGLLILRLSMGILMLTHGWSKLTGFDKMFHSFPDTIGIGSELSYILVVFAEFLCSLLLMVGLFTRLSLVPLIINTLIIVSVANAGDWHKQEFAILYLMAFIGLFFTGPGKYSLDRMMIGKGRTSPSLPVLPSSRVIVG